MRMRATIRKRQVRKDVKERGRKRRSHLQRKRKQKLKVKRIIVFLMISSFALRALVINSVEAIQLDNLGEVVQEVTVLVGPVEVALVDTAQLVNSDEATQDLDHFVGSQNSENKSLVVSLNLCLSDKEVINS